MRISQAENVMAMLEYYTRKGNWTKKSRCTLRLFRNLHLSIFRYPQRVCSLVISGYRNQKCDLYLEITANIVLHLAT